MSTIKIEYHIYNLDKAAKIPKIGNVEVDDIIHLLVNEKINIDETLGFIKRSDGLFHWLEKGLTDVEAKALNLPKGGRGWRHIFIDHIADFKKFGASSEEGVQKLLWETIENGGKKEIDEVLGGVSNIFMKLEAINLKR